jgi:hypothetical protein
MYMVSRRIALCLLLLVFGSGSFASKAFNAKRIPPGELSPPQDCGTPGYACSRIRPGYNASIAVTPLDCFDDKGVRYHETYVSKVVWLKPQQQPDGVVLLQYPEVLYTDRSVNYSFISPSNLPFGEYIVEHISTQSEHCNNWFIDWYVEVIPRITSSVTDLWWFGSGNRPADWDTSMKLVVDPPFPGTYNWKIKSGSDKVKFPNGSDAISTTEPSVDLYSSAQSAAKSDVEIVVSSNYVESDTYRITVRSPNSLVPNYAPIHESDAKYGYLSTISYAIKDQFGDNLPINRLVPINESFKDGLVYDYPGSNWRRGAPGGVLTYADQLRDQIEGEVVGFDRVPEPKAPQKPLGKIKVSHFTGYWSIGSVGSGKGIGVQRNVWQRFQDHGIHQHRVSPIQ